jgi:hypothetical protein
MERERIAWNRNSAVAHRQSLFLPWEFANGFNRG